ncbi:unnamed protein product [Microthlaspi erraticum]|uniref:Uncharacterized protein n=1 Tax=Microthlaspi erraticum TaxID=1685480 RepID=A0A6D2HW08_9BRAS|nr:unnamed protein product [Microthlaspi erraticum]
MLQQEEQDYQMNHPNFNWNSTVWNAKISPKIKVFLWKTIQEVLPIGENLLNRGIPDSACCVPCGELETLEHLFFHCHFARSVWSMAPLSVPLDSAHFQSFPVTLTSSKDWISLPPTGVGNGPLFPWICWSLWKSRNFSLFEDRQFSPEDTMSKAIREAIEWQQAQYPSKTNQKRSNLATKTATNPNAFTCFTDGAWCKDTCIGGAGWIFFDKEGNEQHRDQSAERFVSSSLMAKAMAIRSALNQALDHGHTNLTLHSDAQDLIRVINSQEQSKEIYGLLFDIYTLASMFDSISFHFVARSKNLLADSLAKIAKANLVASLPDMGPTL